MNIDEYLESNGFIESIKGMKEIINLNDDFITMSLFNDIYGIIISGMLLFKDEGVINELLTSYIDYTLSIDLDDYFHGYNKDDLDLSHTIRDIFLYKIKEIYPDKSIEEICHKNYMFHAFNSCFLESIKAYGINPKYKKDIDDSVELLMPIFYKHGLGSMFHFFETKGFDEVCYSLTPFQAFNYGVKSPEWFSTLCGEGDNYTSVKIDSYYNFPNRNYDKCKKDLMKLITHYKFTKKEKAIVENVFEIYWDIYAEGNPTLAIIPTEETRLLGRNDSELLSDYLFSYSDEHTTNVIDTNKATYVKIPTPQELIKKINHSIKK